MPHSHRPSGSYSHRPSGAPRVIGLTMVKNEQDIIEPMIRHNAALLDVLIVLDNGSVDDTRTIAIALARELGNVVVTDSAGFGYTQGERMTRLLHAAQTSYFADFVLFLDADEFIGTNSRAVFHAGLGRIPLNGFGTMLWANFVLIDGMSISDPPHGMGHRTAEVAPIYKVVLRLDGGFQPDLKVSRGSHAVTRRGRLLPGVPLATLPLCHFPIRSHAQLTAKTLVGWIACLAANPDASKMRQSDHWQGMFRRIVDGSGLDASDLRKLSLHYGDARDMRGLPLPPDPCVVFDPPPIDTERRYSTGAYLEPLVLLARSWEQSLRARDVLFRPEEAPEAVIDIPPFRYLHEKYQFESVLDGDCGIGVALEMFARLGVNDIAGVGALEPPAMVLRHGGYVRHENPAVGFSLERRFDLVLCLSTVADQPQEHALTLIGNADRHTDAMIVFCLDDSSAQPLGQWLAWWRRFGWGPDLMETLAVRCLSSDVALRRGLVVLRRLGGEDATAELLAIALRPYQAAATPAGVVDEPLMDVAVAGWMGYAAPDMALADAGG